MSCILTTHAVSKAGYGQRKYKGKMEKAHRVAFCESRGIDLDSIAGMEVRHTCDNPPCINPEHLLLGDAKANAGDRDSRGRAAHQTPGFMPNSVLSDVQVQWVRDNYKPRHKEFGQSAMSRTLGVSQALISLTLSGTRNITR